MTGDLGDVTGLWPFLGLVVLMGLPGFFGWLNSRQTKTLAQDTKEQLNHEVNPNSGGSLRDAVNRLEAGQTDISLTQKKLVEGFLAQDQRLAALERAAVEKPKSKGWRR